MHRSAGPVPVLSMVLLSWFGLPHRADAQTSQAEAPIREVEVALRQSITESLVGVWVGTFRLRDPQTGDISELDYRFDFSPTRTDGFFLGEGGVVRDGAVQTWSHDVYSWDGETGERIISFNGFGDPIVHRYTITGLDVGDDTPDKWSFRRTHTGQVGRLGIIQQRVTIEKDGDRYHMVTENREPDGDEDFEFFYEMILRREAS